MQSLIVVISLSDSRDQLKPQENNDFVVFPIGIPEAVHTNDVLKHNKLSLKEVACKLSLQRKFPPS
jgi:hypothetical protein